MIRHYIGMGFVWVGILFDFLGVLGLLRLPDVYNRLQAATKCVTFGSAGLLFGVFVLKGFTSFGFKVLLAIAFIFLTSPIAAHAIARAAHRSGVPLSPESVVDLYEADHELKEEDGHAAS
jgi:multicomponent Na+:H+ antiporter subunit G